MSVTDTGIDELFAGLHAEAGAAGVYELAVSNATAHAVYVEALLGYFVIDGEHLLQTAAEAMRELLGADVPLSRANILLALDKAGYDEVAWLRSLTGATTPDGRQRHPGYFADVTGQLANGYTHEVTVDA